MALTFFNPASLLPDPKAAVKPAPQGDNMAVVAIGSAMQAIRDNLRKKKEVDDLISNTNAVADYMEERSPDLAKMLRQRTETYRPTAFTGFDAIDVEKEKSSLLKGVIDLYGTELDAQKAAAAGGAISLQNNFSTKLRSAESNLANVNNNWNAWESQETRREAEYEDTRRRLAAQGKADGMPKFVRGSNPYTAEKDQAQRVYNDLMNSTPSDISGMATVSRVKGAGGSKPIMPSYGLETPMTDEEKAADQDRAMEEVELPSNPNNLPPDYETLGLGSNILIGDDQLRAAEAENERLAAESSQSTETVPGARQPVPGDILAGMTGSNGGTVGGAAKGEIVVPPVSSAPPSDDPVAKLNETAKMQNAANVKAYSQSIDLLINSVKREKGTFIDPSSAEAVATQGEELKQELLSLPDPGSESWVNQAKVLISAYKTSIATLQRNSAAGEKKEQSVANQEQLQYYVRDSVKKEPITIYKRIQDGMPRFYILEGGKEVEVTNKIGIDYLPLDSATSLAPSVTKPGSKPLSVSDIFNRK